MEIFNENENLFNDKDKYYLYSIYIDGIPIYIDISYKIYDEKRIILNILKSNNKKIKPSTTIYIDNTVKESQLVHTFVKSNMNELPIEKRLIMNIELELNKEENELPETFFDRVLNTEKEYINLYISNGIYLYNNCTYSNQLKFIYFLK
jgi:hypothetical protein